MHTLESMLCCVTLEMQVSDLVEDDKRTPLSICCLFDMFRRGEGGRIGKYKDVRRVVEGGERLLVVV